jgi:hypothetical protein
MRNVLLAAFLPCLFFAAKPARPAPDKITYLNQGWTDAERQQFYYLAQGSEIMPYAWFLALEQPWNDKPFRDAKHIESFRYLPNDANESNPDGLPVGFTKGKGPGGEMWFGLTCAACHTGQVNYKGHSVRIDGGTNIADAIAFQSSLVTAMRATLAERPKFERFAKHVLGKDHGADKAKQLEARVREQLVAMANWEASSRPAHPTGFGNWDAVNILMNTINATALSEPSNNRTPQVPVSYPSIWLTNDLDWLLWNGSIQNGTVRAVGEVIIVFGRAKVTSTGGGLKFDSSADVKALDEVYGFVSKLEPPKWPEDLLGQIDAEKAKRGAAIYEREGCTKCHGNKPPYPLSDPEQGGKRYIQVSRTPIAEVGTDPNYAKYFVGRTAVPGIMAPTFKGTAVENQPVIPAALLFLNTLTNITVAGVDAAAKTPQDRQALLGGRPLPALPKNKQELDELVKSLLVYKATPLPGIWSTAPYLHNASVPNLYQLLLPPEKRVKSFYLGNREFDPEHVGYRTEAFEGGYRFDTTLSGYSNQGHEYGTKITDEERWALLEYLKTL